MKVENCILNSFRFFLSDDRVICFLRKTDDYIDDLNIHETFYENNKRKIITFVECINFVRKRASLGIMKKLRLIFSSDCFLLSLLFLVTMKLVCDLGIVTKCYR